MWSFKISDFPHFSSFGFAKKTSLLCNLGFLSRFLDSPRVWYELLRIGPSIVKKKQGSIKKMVHI